ncbi:MAG: hypothetical protein ACRDGE_10250 [Candidatus Limnocylindria bacterium]
MSAAHIIAALACGKRSCKCATAVRKGTGLVHCAAHPDEKPALNLSERDGRVLVHCFAGCSQDAVIEALRERGLWPKARAKGGGARIPRATAARTHAHSTAGLTLAQYAEAKRLPADFLRALGLSDMTYQGSPVVRIPYIDASGAEVSVQFRIALSGDDKFRIRSGDRAALYLAPRPDLRREPTIVEGPSDTQTLWHFGEAAIGLPSASISDGLLAQLVQLLASERVVHLVREPGDAGEKLAHRIAATPLRDRVRVLDLGAHKDPSAMYLADPATFGDRWRAATSKAVPLSKLMRAEAEARRAELWDHAQEIAAAPRILDLVARAVERLGLVGERRAALLMYLVLASRLLPRPVNAAVKAVSSAGKSYTVDRVLALFSTHSYFLQTAMSERALIYSEEPLAHRVLVLYEAAGLGKELGSYIVRSLLSEGRISYTTVEKTSEGMRPRAIEREGPTGLLLTTTAPRLHAENETRLFSIPISDDREQTARIIRHLAGTNGHPAENVEPWHAFDEWLSLGPAEVTIPYGPALGELLPPVAVRLRRDFGAILSLVRVHALLHQASRGRDEHGHVIATIEDYAAIRELVADLVSEGVGQSVPATVRQTVGAVARLIESGTAEPTYAHVAKALELDRSAAQRRCAVAIGQGYLRNLEERERRPARLALGDPLPDDVALLPDPERVQECVRAEGDMDTPLRPDTFDDPMLRAARDVFGGAA